MTTQRRAGGRPSPRWHVPEVWGMSLTWRQLLGALPEGDACWKAVHEGLNRLSQGFYTLT